MVRPNAEWKESVSTLALTPNPPPNGGEGFGDACRGLDGESVGGQCLDSMVKEA